MHPFAGQVPFDHQRGMDVHDTYDVSSLQCRVFQTRQFAVDETDSIISFPCPDKALSDHNLAIASSFRHKAACASNARPYGKPVQSNHSCCEASAIWESLQFEG
jgi:hypothetical protein